MSKYTVQIRWLVEQAEKDAWGTYSPGVYTDASYKALGMDTYPIFDESYRHLLNDKIIGHYYFNEIGFETAAQFAWYMRQKLLEIMPYYNQLYESLDKVKEPFTDMDVEHNEGWDRGLASKTTTDSDSTSDTTDHTDTNDRTVFSDTPMSMLHNSGSPNVENLDYATTVTYYDSTMDGTSNNVSTNKSTGTEDTTEAGTKAYRESGRHKSESELLKEWRSTFINVDARIIEELSDLFMGVW